jgi:hypothetical protein
MDSSKRAILVKDRHSLQMEKARLIRICNSMEAEAEERLEHVKKHYGAMAFNSFFPHADAQAGIARLLGYAAKGAFKSSSFKTALITIGVTVVEIIGAKKIVDLFEKLFSKKKKGGDKKEEHPHE